MTGARWRTFPPGPWMWASVAAEVKSVYDPVTLTEPVAGSTVSVAVPAAVLGSEGILVRGVHGLTA